jgi:hypothetical protein
MVARLLSGGLKSLVGGLFLVITESARLEFAARSVISFTLKANGG